MGGLVLLLLLFIFVSLDLEFSAFHKLCAPRKFPTELTYLGEANVLVPHGNYATFARD